MVAIKHGLGETNPGALCGSLASEWREPIIQCRKRAAKVSLVVVVLVLSFSGSRCLILVSTDFCFSFLFLLASKVGKVDENAMLHQPVFCR